MSNYGFNTKVNPDAPISQMPGSKFLELRDMLDTNPADKDWRALIRCVEDKYDIRPIYIEQWSVNTKGQAAGNLLIELSSLGMTVGELESYLRKINVDTYNLGLAPHESVKIIQHPDEFLEACEGGSLEMSVEATGNPLPRYQWFFCKDGTDDFKPLLGRTENKLRLENLKSDNAGTYACQVHNCGDPAETKISEHCLVSVTADTDLHNYGLNPPPEDIIINTGILEPLDKLLIQDRDIKAAQMIYPRSIQKLIIRQPKDVEVAVNENFSISVETQGNPPIWYRWFNGETRLDCTSSKLEMTVLSKYDFGGYYCVVSNGNITEKSDIARVKEKVTFPQMTPEIEIISHPKSVKVPFGAGAIFSCEAKCSEPLKYQWFKDGSPMRGENSSEVKFKNIQDTSVAGQYQCEISINLPGREQFRRMTVCAFLTVEIPNVNDNVRYNPSDKVALLIGNSDYRSEQNLQAPPFDVQVLQDLFRKLDFKVLSLLNLTKREIESAVLEFCTLVDKNVYCVFYFVGHGFEEEGLSYLVPTDAPSGYKCDECVCANAVLDNIQKRDPTMILMILDICRKRNRVNSTRNAIPQNLERQTKKGHTVFCYATSEGMNAYEHRGNGLLVAHLGKLLTKNIGIDALISELKEEFNSNERHRGCQIPELRSNLAEPRRSLADKISTRGSTQRFQERTLIWKNAHVKPETQEILFRDVGIRVQLAFQSDFSNILHVFTKVLNRGIADVCTAWTINTNPSISTDNYKKWMVKADDPVSTKVTLLDIQKLQNPLCIDVYIECEIKGASYRFKTERNLGLPLVSRLKLWQQRENFVPLHREPIEQTEESDSLEK